MSGDDEAVRWNPLTQTWDTGTPQSPVTGPPASPPEAHPPTQVVPPTPSYPAPSYPPPTPPPPPGQAWPQQSQQPQQPWPQPELPTPPPRPSGWRRAGLVLTVVLVMLGAGYGTWFFLDKRDQDAKSDAKQSASPTPGPSKAEPSPGPSTEGPSASPSSSGVEVPPGYRLVTEPEFALVVPQDWERRTVDGEKGVTVYYYEEPDGGARDLRIFPITEENPTATGVLETADAIFEKQFKNYTRNSIEDAADEQGGALLDYSYDSEKLDTRMRAVYRVFGSDPDQLYGLVAAGPADDWPEQQSLAQTGVESFCLTGAC
ncbi:hypothetical protein [Streptomyces sp. NBC_01304]|uniref:hypothetical protein n=1 Tax=Streptomyces sp. NBC_01304 TaxID=2903818 RepID=UPI002E154214|nr:hypothetical protein OG430_20225 [Streptomyces sp. NBC_01304]